MKMCFKFVPCECVETYASDIAQIQKCHFFGLWEELCAVSTERAQRLYEDEESKVLLLDFVYHLRRISRQAAIFMCSWHSGLVVLPCIFSNFCQKCAQGNCKKKCGKLPKGISLLYQTRVLCRFKIFRMECWQRSTWCQRLLMSLQRREN